MYNQQYTDLEVKKLAKDFLNRCSSDKIMRFRETEAVRKMYSRFYENLEYTSKTPEYYGAEVFQALNNLIQRAKFPDFTFEGVGVSKLRENMTASGVVDIMHVGDLPNVYAGTDGAVFDSFLTGRGYITAFRTKNPEAPVQFLSIPEENVYIDPFANDIHGSAKGKNARELAIIISYRKSTLYAKYPELKKNDIGGMIQRSYEEDSIHTDNQESEQNNDEIELIHYYNIDLGIYTIMAGSECYVLEMKTGDEYPYVVEGENAIPVYSLRCFANTKGFYSPGIGTVIFRSVRYLESLGDAKMKQVMDSTYNYDFINVGMGRKEEFFQSLIDADKLRDNKDRAFVVNEVDPLDPNGSQVSVQTISSSNTVPLFDQADQFIQRVLRRFGINLDQTESGQNKTATQILSEVQSQNLLLEQFGEFNASELKSMFSATIEIIKTIPKSNKTVVSLRTRLDEELEADIGGNLTFGMVSQQLRDTKFVPHFNLRTGYLPSKELERKDILELMPYVQGTAYMPKLISDYAKTRGREIKPEEITGQPTSPQQAQQAEGELQQLNPQTTDLLTSA